MITITITRRHSTYIMNFFGSLQDAIAQINMLSGVVSYEVA